MRTYGHLIRSPKRTPVNIHLRFSYADEPMKEKANERFFPEPEWHAHVISTELDANTMHFLVFADNTAKALLHVAAMRRLIPDLSIEVIDLDVPSSLFLMTRCTHHILTLSTFGLWGAYLSIRQEAMPEPGKVFYPRGLATMDIGPVVIPPLPNWKLVLDP